MPRARADFRSHSSWSGSRASLEAVSSTTCASCAVRHPNLLAYFGAWTTDDLLIIGMELAECSLWDRFNRLSREHLAGIPFSELLAIMGEVARVIDFLNEPRHELDGKTERRDPPSRHQASEHHAPGGRGQGGRLRPVLSARPVRDEPQP